MRQHGYLVANLDVADRNIFDSDPSPAMRKSRHPFGERPQHRRGFGDGKPFQGVAARQHQHDNRAGEILAEQGGGDDRNAREVVRAKLSVQPAPDQAGDQRDAAGDQRHEKREIHPDVGGAGTETKPEVDADSDDRQNRNTRIVAGDESGRTFVTWRNRSGDRCGHRCVR